MGKSENGERSFFLQLEGGSAVARPENTKRRSVGIEVL